jgi:hypothetical protein
MIHNDPSSLCPAERLAGAAVDILGDAPRFRIGNRSRSLSGVKPINVEYDLAGCGNERRPRCNKYLYVAGGRDACHGEEESGSTKQRAHEA